MAAREDNIWLKLSAGNLEEVWAAFQAGGDPNTRGGTDNKTCLMWAIIRGNEEMVDVLLEQPSIEVNAKDNNESTALHWACARNNVAILNQLLVLAAPAASLLPSRLLPRAALPSTISLSHLCTRHLHAWSRPS